MKRTVIDLHDEFVEALFRKEPKRAELVKLVSSVLKIEKEPASRRLNKTVLFSVREMGLLARELDLSIDTLLNPGNPYRMTPLMLDEPMEAKSMDQLAGLIESHINDGVEITEEGSELGSVFGQLPFEFFVPYGELMKFTLFSWGHNFIPSAEFDKYSDWELPPRFAGLLERYVDEIYGNMGKLIYLWNDSLIWHLVRKVNYFHSMYVITSQEKEAIRENIHQMLTGLESGIRNQADSPKFQFYIANVNIDTTAWYHISEAGSSALLKNNFMHTSLIKERDYCMAIKNWIYSLKHLSTLISGSGHKERRLFFEEQHKIVDAVLSQPPA